MPAVAWYEAQTSSTSDYSMPPKRRQFPGEGNRNYFPNHGHCQINFPTHLRPQRYLPGMNHQSHRRILAECLRFLSVNGVSVDDSVKAIIEFFFSADHHVSLTDIQNHARTRRLSISREQISRTLSLLVEYGFAVRKEFGESTTVYEHLHLGEHHDHFYCLRCGRIIEFVSAGIEQLQLEEARKAGFHAFSHRMQIHGLCGECFGEAEQTLLQLTMVQKGGKFRVVGYEGEKKGKPHRHARRRFADLGLVPGAEGEVINNSLGMLVINLHGSRIALGRGESRHVTVTLRN
jgi:Fur family ferric uptake transcriptional regulator